MGATGCKPPSPSDRWMQTCRMDGCIDGWIRPPLIDLISIHKAFYQRSSRGPTLHAHDKECILAPSIVDVIRHYFHLIPAKRPKKKILSRDYPLGSKVVKKLNINFPDAAGGHANKRSRVTSVSPPFYASREGKSGAEYI